MRKLLSQKAAIAAKAKTKPYQIHDATIPGLILRVQPTGTKTWKLVQNRKPRTLGRFPVMTFGMAKGLAEAILRGEDPDAVEDDQPVALTFDGFLDDHYQAFIQANHSQPNETMARLRRFDLGDKLLSEIKLAHVETWRIERQNSGTSPATINRDLSALNASFQKAYDWELLDAHPLARLKPLKVDKRPVVRYLSPPEETRLQAALVARDDEKREGRLSGNAHRRERGYKTYSRLGIYADNLTPLVLLAINTGLRRGELWNLTWGDIDLKRKMLTVRGKGAKSGQTRHVPLNAAAVDVLKNHRGRFSPIPAFRFLVIAFLVKELFNLGADAMFKNFRFIETRNSFD
jgi:integrase